MTFPLVMHTRLKKIIILVLQYCVASFPRADTVLYHVIALCVLNVRRFKLVKGGSERVYDSCHVCVCTGQNSEAVNSHGSSFTPM